ncbi:MAG TPA: DUF885 domain-containing protein [Mobilitalea sp.]|nr:DUF885 domain-containing protein [Mobilitalea sp.]
MYKKLKTYFVLLFILIFSLLNTGCTSSLKSENYQKKFDNFIKELFIKEVQSDSISLNYSLANPEAFGIKNTKASLGEYSVRKIKEDLMTVGQYLKELDKIDYNSLTADRQLTYDILYNYLETEMELGNYIYYFESLGPTTGLQAQLPILLAEFNFYDKDDIDRYLELLPCVYDYFEDIVEFEKEKSEKGLFMSDAVADRIIEQCKAFISDPENNFLIEYFNEKIENFSGLTKQETEKYKEKNRQRVLEYIIPSYQMLISALESLKGTGINDAGLYYYPEGQAYYECLVKYKTGSAKSMDEIIDMLETAIDKGFLEINRLLLTDTQILNKLESFTSFPLTDPVEILEDLKNDILTDFPEPVEVNCEIKYVHESLSEYLSPAMYLIPAIDNYTNNHIYINGNDDETLATIYTTVAHEGYPGHLYQNVYFRSQNPAPIRSILDFVGYDEGWATYVEFLSYKYAGIDPNLADLLELNNRILLLMYARADIGIHYEGWKREKAISYINKFSDDEKISAKIYEILLEEPAAYLPYAVGYLEITGLKNKAEEALGDNFNLKEFHRFLLDIGPAQFGIIEKYLDAWLENKKIN